MTYKAWKKIDDGSEGAWSPDVWLGVIEAVSRHEGELVYDEAAEVYVELEAKFPQLKWRGKDDNGNFRPYFCDFSKPWTHTKVISFDGKFSLTKIGRNLVARQLSARDCLASFVKKYEEDGENPFAILADAFFQANEPLSIEDIYFGVMLGFRHGDIFNDSISAARALTGAEMSSTTKRRLILLLTIFERIGGVVKIKKNGVDHWRAWDCELLKSIYLVPVNQKHKFIQSCIPKPFLLLAGISGTGKTRFVREQAALHRNAYPTNHCLVPVRPDWHEPSDLLGYISRIGQDGARYVVTDLLRFVVKAWQDAKALASATELVSKPPAEMTPYWLCLDEMNLAPVEQYFADYLSVLETREWADGVYRCDPLLKSATIEQLDAVGQDELRNQLGLGAKHDDLWQYFTAVGIPLPPNLIVAGTVNMDETTHGFSRKVIDRAFTIDFGAFYPNDFADFFAPTTLPVALGFPVLSGVTQDDLAAIPADADGAKSLAFLGAVNGVLKATPFELAYRALNELLLAVVCFQPKDDAELQAVWDDFLMTKVLPRIDGDAEKLGVNDEISLLTKLLSTIDEQLKLIISERRPDLLREEIGGGVCMVDCRSKQKLAWMQERLRMNGFTTFWP